MPVVIGRKGAGGGGSGGGVTSLAKSGDAALTGAVTLSEGSNVTLTQVGQDIEIAAASGGGGLFASYAQLSHTVANGTNGGDSSASFTTCPLTAEDFDPDGIVALAANQFTLQAGTYFIDAWKTIEAPNARCKAKIRNITAGSDALVGMSVYIPGASNGGMIPVRGRFTLAGATVLELQARAQAGVVTDGYGVPASFTLNEVYATVTIYLEA